MNGYVRTETDREGITTLTLDAPGKSVNTLNRATWDDLAEALEQVERDKPAGLIITSGKQRTFVAGADLFEMRGMSAPELQEYIRRGQVILDRLAALPIPTVAAINGDALGGGLELALACKHRVALDEVGTIGLPETKLGLVPGWGGTVRLPRLIGLKPALLILVAGKALSPREAEEVGIVDELAGSDEVLGRAARQRLRARVRPRAQPRAEDASIFTEQESDVRKRTRGHYPAQSRVIVVVRAGWEQGQEAGSRAEREALCELRDTSEGKALMRAFFLRTGAKKAAVARAGGATPRKVERVAIVGGGVMGAGVAHAMLKSGIPVSLVEISSDAADRAKQRLAALFNDDVSAGRMDGKAADEAMRKFVARTDWDSVGKADFILEAVVEQLDAKREVMTRADEVAKPDAVIASNTSSLSIRELAEATKNPARVVGLHFFNPVPKMALVEVVNLPTSDRTATATAIALASRVGKTPVVVGDGPGFIVNRLLMPYLSEAMRLVGEGHAPDAIDKQIVEWGMPMGPLALIDQIGMDVIVGIFRAMAPKLGSELIALPRAADQILERGWLGRKTDRGFYNYPPRAPRATVAPPTVNNELVTLLGGARAAASAKDTPSVLGRLVLPMGNEAARLLSEGVADSTDAIDTATLLGMGFPAFRGGLAAHADFVGAAELVKQLEALAFRHGPRFDPAPLLREVALSGKPLADVHATPM